MPLIPYLLSALLLLATAFVVFRIIVRRDYLKHKRLTFVTSLLQFLLWIAYMLGFPSLYNPPYWMSVWVDDGKVDPVLRTTGLVLITAGVVAALAVMAHLGFRRSLGRQADVLKQTGLYRVTRNPGIVMALPLIIGGAIRWPSWYALGWVFLFVIMIHTMVITEEEHLRDLFGDEYEQYCTRVPRYLSIRR